MKSFRSLDLYVRNERIFSELLDTYYSEFHRTYHNSDHIIECLKIWSMLTSSINITFEQELKIAILFHDIIYDVGSKDNEKRSAELAVKYGPYFFTDINWDVVHDIIMSTVHDGGEVPLLAARYMINIDLYTLGSSVEDYRISSDNIRREFTTKYSDQTYNEGRKAFLQTMIARPSIFYTLDNPMLDVIFQKMNDRAKINMQSELDELTNMDAF